MVQSHYGPEIAEPAAACVLITAARLVKTGRNPWKLIVSALTLTTRWAKIFLPKCFSESKLFPSLNVLLPIGMAFVAASKKSSILVSWIPLTGGVGAAYRFRTT